MSNNITIIFKTGGLGDLLMLSPCIRSYKKIFSQERLLLIVGDSNKNVMTNNPYIDETLTVNDNKIFQGNLFQKIWHSLLLMRMIRRLKAEKIFVCHRDWRWNLVAFLAGVPRRYGFRRDLKGRFLTASADTTQEEHEIYKYAKVFGLCEGFKLDSVKMDIFITDEDERVVRELLGEIEKSSSFIAISPGGATNAKLDMDLKRWPNEYYKKLVQLILNNTSYSVMLVGARSDLRFTEPLRLHPTRVRDITGKTTIAQTCCALSKSKLLITQDSGPMHIGAAAGIPVIGLFGPTYPREYAPVTHPKSIYIWKGDTLGCSPCYKDGIFPKSSNKRCMYLIAPEEVFEKMKQVIESYVAY